MNETKYYILISVVTLILMMLFLYLIWGGTCCNKKFTEPKNAYHLIDQENTDKINNNFNSVNIRLRNLEKEISNHVDHKKTDDIKAPELEGRADVALSIIIGKLWENKNSHQPCTFDLILFGLIIILGYFFHDSMVKLVGLARDYFFNRKE